MPYEYALDIAVLRIISKELQNRVCMNGRQSYLNRENCVVKAIKFGARARTYMYRDVSFDRSLLSTKGARSLKSGGRVSCRIKVPK